VRIVYGKGGALQTIMNLATSNPRCGVIFSYLARSYERFDQYNDAARFYKVAAAEASDPTSHAKLLGRAVLVHAHAKAAAEVLAGAVGELKTYVRANNVSEYELLIVLRQLAEIEKNEQATIAFMQRMVECDPSDADTRFALAYKHAESGNDELALYHYLLIPSAQRTSTTWNNLGVAFDKVKLPAKSVNAYQKAKDEGDTLAMSNLAFKCLSAGFLVEARALIDDALKRTNVHGNIPRALTQLEEQEANESTTLVKITDKCSAANTFYNEFGAAMLRIPSRDLSGRWKELDCELEVIVNGASFIAKGQYDRNMNALGMVAPMSYLHIPPSRFETWMVEYEGTVSGCAVEARLYRQRVGETPSLLEKFGNSTRVLMKLSEDECEFEVMTLLKDQVRTFDKITRIS
jgi:tetratricopeptide (TPR) repeat protein